MAFTHAEKWAVDASRGFVLYNVSTPCGYKWLSWRSLGIAEHQGLQTGWGLGLYLGPSRSNVLLPSSLSHLPLGSSALAQLTQGLSHMTVLRSLR